MLIKLSSISLNVEVYPSKNPSTDFIFLLHGFTGSSGDWKQIVPSICSQFNLAAVDLIGHGMSDSPEDVSFYSSKSIVEQITELIKYFTGGKIILAGYSMGGRAALSFAVKHPEMLKGLILESTSAGIEEKSLRTARSNSDNELACYIESHSTGKFIDYWMNIDLFASQKNLPEEKLNAVRSSKLKNNRTGLANTLRGFSTGKMPLLLDQIKKIKCKTLLITGDLDTKYTLINSELLKQFPAAEHVIVKNAGHNIHLEKPEDFIRVINSFLNKF